MLIPIENLPIDTVGEIDPENGDSYPYYELLVDIVSNGLKRPLVFKDDHGTLECIEGRHRFHVLALLHRHDPEYFKKVVGNVEVIFAGEAPVWCESPNGVDTSWFNRVKRLRRVYEKFLHRK